MLATLNSKATVSEDLGQLVEDIAKEALPGDHVIVMSNGEFGNIHEKLLSRFAA